jgi:ATP-dependent Lon protease
MASEPARTYPSELPVLALRQTVVFPLTLQPLSINRPLSVESINRALAGDRLVFLALQHTDAEEPERGDLRTIGTIGAIRQMAKVPNGGIHVIVEGLQRARSNTATKSGVSLRAIVSPAPDVIDKSLEVDACVRRLHELTIARCRWRPACRRGCAAWSPASTTRCGSPTCWPACST